MLRGLSLSDVHDKATRSRNMSAIRAKNTRPEMIVRRGLYARGFRYRVHCRNIPGRPDLANRSRKVAVFVNGCFWHAHDGCRYFKIPKTDTEKWNKKLMGNRVRDERNYENLRSCGWQVFIVWECSLKTSKLEVERFLNRLMLKINSC